MFELSNGRNFNIFIVLDPKRRDTIMNARNPVRTQRSYNVSPPDVKDAIWTL